MLEKTIHDLPDLIQLAKNIKDWGNTLGFQQVGITNTDLSAYERKFQAWLKAGYHGEMHFMEKHGSKRSRPEELIPGTRRIISVRMDYLPPQIPFIKKLATPFFAYLSCYALGRDYHRLMRQRLQALVDKIQGVVSAHHYRVFTDSAPVLEKPIAEKAGLGWIGKHTTLINRKGGSWFFLGEIYTDCPLPIDQPETSHCGSCHACIDICPTQAIIAPYILDARRCISYLTIELRTSIPLELRPLIGNRIYGCDDCQLICPWNKFAKIAAETRFHARDVWKHAELIELFQWEENEFLQKTEGSAIRRIGHECWLRNIAVALGNAPYSEKIMTALHERSDHPSEMVKEHINWALERQMQKKLNSLSQ